MSLPSISAVANRLGVKINEQTPKEQLEKVLVEAMRLDLPLAIELLHKKSHEAKDGTGVSEWIEDPNSPIGRQLTRIHAGTVLRDIASKHFCHGLALTFMNCCKGFVGRPPENPMLVQIQCQAGPIAYSDC